MPYSPITATLGYVIDGQGNVLLIHRNKRQNDQARGKMNGLGGKVDAGEDIAACMVRELYEEAGITVTGMTLRGTVSWPGFGKNGEDWLGFIFIINAFTGTVSDGNAEGDLLWKPIDELVNGTLPLWPGDKYFLPLVFDDDPRPFHGVMPYESGDAISWNFSRF